MFFCLEIDNETKMFKAYPTVTKIITGRNPLNIFKMNVEQRNAIRDAMPHEVRQNP